MPLVLAIRTHVFAAERLHGDDTTVPVLAKERTRIGRRVGAMSGTTGRSAGPIRRRSAFFYSPDRSGEHPERHLAGFAGILQADAYAGFNRLYAPEARAGADPRGRLLGTRPTQAVRAGRGQQGADRGRGGAADRRAVRDRARASTASLPRSAWRSGRSGRSRLVLELEAWLRVQHARVSRKSEIGKAIAYALNHWKALTRFLEDGRICMSNNAAERALRGVAVGRRNWTFAGSEQPATRCSPF